MLIRALPRCSVVSCPKYRSVFRHPSYQASKLPFCHKIATSRSFGEIHSPAHSILGHFRGALDKIAPRFDVNAQQISILDSPTDFYTYLKARIRSAEKTVFLSTLYIGKEEHELISVLQEALRSTRQLKLSILTDALRGTRESPETSCASLLSPLVSEFGEERVEIRMYHTPNLTGLRKSFIPKRVNEGWGLQHMKIYGFDEEIILSGANLSKDYFTNRQDRYISIKSVQIRDFYLKLHQAVCRLSFLVTPSAQTPAGYTLEWPATNSGPSPLHEPRQFISTATKILTPLIQPQPNTHDQLSDSKPKTTIYPIAQLTPLLHADTSTEFPVLSTILKLLSDSAAPTSSWTFTAGYFNPSPLLIALLLSTTASVNNTIITASPQANGFFSSPGISGLLPSAYTLLSRRFLQSVHKAGRENEITMKEWRRGTVGEEGGWTYHAKGLWITMDSEEGPSLSVVGSSNYTKRSYSLDLEAGAVIVTEDKDLKRRLARERDRLGEYTRTMSLEEFEKKERRVGLRVRVAMWIVKMVGGAL